MIFWLVLPFDLFPDCKHLKHLGGLTFQANCQSLSLVDPSGSQSGLGRSDGCFCAEELKKIFSSFVSFGVRQVTFLAVDILSFLLTDNARPGVPCRTKDKPCIVSVSKFYNLICLDWDLSGIIFLGINAIRD